MEERKGKKIGKIKNYDNGNKDFGLNRMEDAYQEVVGNNVEDVKWDQTMEVLESQF